MTQISGALRFRHVGPAPSRARAVPAPRLVMLRSVGWLCVATAAALSLLGVVAIGTVEPAPGEVDFARNHVLHLLLAVAACAAVAVPHYRAAQRASYPAMAAILLVLVFVLIPHVPESIVRVRNGARRWINLGVMDFQPSELAKIVYVLALASYLRFRDNYRRLAGLMLPMVLTFVPLGLVLVEPDLGTSLLFLPTLFAMLVAAGAKLRHLALVMVVGAALAPAMYPLLEDHQKNRIKAMAAQIVGDPRYENDIGFQAARAVTLAGAGGWTGVGQDHAAALVRFNRLPEDHNDMIFAVIGCRWGMAGAGVVWCLYLALCLGGLKIASQCKDPFGRLVPVGITALFFSQMAINTGMSIGLLPITGLTLPFVSAGGSSLVTAWIMVGLLLNIALRHQRSVAPESFEFSDEEE